MAWVGQAGPVAREWGEGGSQPAIHFLPRQADTDAAHAERGAAFTLRGSEGGPAWPRMSAGHEIWPAPGRGSSLHPAGKL